ncbi:biotin transport system substrate-specific component [Cereibacter ovatus]|uniref:Biotin transporter n=1 Tax=Cereibacter ovatus TaxID=439529 RepID=A0A285CJ69_9RHOB|nr:biotin transporter BioY [Cereibacter ovatus]SNX67395.1 biotin transport system substrate-specific component [Cereibacter ovatus]
MERNVAYIALFAALIAVLGLVPQITLMSGVPITAQSLGVMLCGAVLGARKGALAVLLFLVLVFLGLPLLSGGRGGIGVLAGPTAGFVVGFPVAAFVTGLVVEKWRSAPVVLAAFVGAVLGGVVVLYGFGLVGMALKLGKTLPETAMLLTPFVAGDLLKTAIAALITKGLSQVRPGVLLSRS